ncbi:MAG: type II/IV secretion system ATPase subunit [Candidatus Aenigmatarchaeota archaeon]
MEINVIENKLQIDLRSGWSDLITIEDGRETMKLVIENLLANKNIVDIIILGDRELEYDFEKIKILREIANCYEAINYKKLLTPLPEEIKFFESLSTNFEILNNIVENIKSDIIESYKKLVLLKKRLSFLAQKTKNNVLAFFIEKHIIPIIDEMKKTTIIKLLIEKEEIEKYIYKPKDRSIYREILSPIIRPIFMETKFYLVLPKDSIKIEEYEIKGNLKVEIYKVPNKVRYIYVLHAPEFYLNSDEIRILERVREYLTEHKPSEAELRDFQKTREAFYNLELDLIKRVAEELNTPIPEKRVKELADILVRYTVGFGILERILADENVTDIYINAPIGMLPIFVQHVNYEECETNIVISAIEAENWATKFRLYSGRPLDEANPVLDTELNIPEGRARVAITTRSLNPEGLSFAFRRHRDKPWTLPLLIKKKAINPLFAGLMNFIAAGGRSFLVAGGRGSGKTSLLGAIMLEIPRKYRIIVIEDTLELPVPQMRELGFNVERLKSRSVITKVESELPAEEALRTALRLGDSALIIGEIRSTEALTLFEAMRVGALAHSVAGTIHGESAYGVFDRVVNDLKVPKTSFKAVDLIIISANLKSADGLRRYKRVVEVVEVKKHWEEDPLAENAFVPLMIYNAKEDSLLPTQTLINGESFVIREISKRIPEFYGNWDLVWNNILLRAKIKQRLVELSEELKKPELLEADFVVWSNELFNLISEEVKNEIGKLDSNEIYKRWEEKVMEKI